MAGDWIKMRANLSTHPKVLMIADTIAGSTDIGRRLTTGFNGCLNAIVTSDVTRDITLASLFRVWCAANEHTGDGIWHNSTPKTLDQAAGIPGFGEAMVLAGWAVYDEEARTVTLPDFLEYNAPAKGNSRSSAAERQARYREKQRQLLEKEAGKSNAQRNRNGDVTRDVTSNGREEKRREERKTPPAPEGFERFWASYPKRRNRGDAEKAWAKLKPDELTVQAILDAVEVAKAGDDWSKDEGRFIPYPASWLNAKGWLDDLGSRREWWLPLGFGSKWEAVNAGIKEPA